MVLYRVWFLLFIHDYSFNISVAGTNVLELKLKALIMDNIHNIEVVEMLIENRIRSTEHWLWQKQLRLDLWLYM